MVVKIAPMGFTTQFKANPFVNFPARQENKVIIKVQHPKTTRIAKLVKLAIIAVVMGW
jgi:hypothetical protein